jgi:hypothetical protein
MDGRHRLLTAVAGLAIAGLVGSGAVAAGSSGTLATTTTQAITTTLRYQAQIVEESWLDLGAPGNSQGDQDIVRGPLFDATGSTRVGSFEGVCIVTQPSPSQGQCTLTARISGEGQLTSQGHSLIPFVRFANAVTGGTRTFRGAQGQVNGVALTPATLELVYRIGS